MTTPTAWQTFAEAFFTHFGATLYPGEDDLIVDLPPPLVEHFGKERLYLAFPQGEKPRALNANEDLLAYGSKTFELMQALLLEQGELSAYRWPARFSATRHPDLPRWLSEEGLVWREVVQCETGHHFDVLTYRVVLVSDERQEQLLTLVLNEAGREQPWLAAYLTSPALNQAEAVPPPTKPPDVAALFTAAEPIAHEAIQAHVVAAAEAANARLQAALRRLDAYYHQIIAEGEADPQRQSELEADLRRKMDEERLRFRLSVTLTPLSYARAELPLAEVQLQLESGHLGQAVHVTRNLHDNAILHCHCQTCRTDVLHSLHEFGRDPCPHQGGTCFFNERLKAAALLAGLGESVSGDDLPFQRETSVTADGYRWWRLAGEDHVLFWGEPQGWQRDYQLVGTTAAGEVRRQERTPQLGRWLRRLWGRLRGTKAD